MFPASVGDLKNSEGLEDIALRCIEMFAVLRCIEIFAGSIGDLNKLKSLMIKHFKALKGSAPSLGRLTELTIIDYISV